MARERYPTDLTVDERRVLEPLIPPAKPGSRPHSVDVREIINGIRYVLRSGDARRLLPHDLPPWETVYAYFRRWQVDGPLGADRHHPAGAGRRLSDAESA